MKRGLRLPPMMNAFVVRDRVYKMILLVSVCFSFYRTAQVSADASEHRPDQHFAYDPDKEVGAPFIRNYTSKDFQTNSQSWGIVQDHRGVMYIGNNEGILEFDGSSWQKITLTDKVIALSLTIDKDAVIYVGAIGEIGYLASDDKGKMHYVSLLGMVPKECRKFGRAVTYATSQGVYFVTDKFIFRLFDNKMEAIRPEGVNKFIAFPAYDDLYVMDINKQNEMILYRLDGSKLDPIPLPTSLVEQSIKTLLPYSENRLLVVASSGKSFVFNPDLAKKNPDKIDLPEICVVLPTEIEEYLSQNRLYFGAKKYRDKYIFNTLLGGIVIMDANGKLIRVVNENRGLLDNCVGHVFVDRDGNLWAAMSKGIAHIQISSPLSIYNEKSGFDSIGLDYLRAYGKLYISGFDGVHILPEYTLQSKNDRKSFVPVKGCPTVQAFEIVEMYNKYYVFLQPSGANTNSEIYQIDQEGAHFFYKTDFPTVVLSACRSNKFPNHLFLGLNSNGLAAIEFDPSSGKIIKMHSNTGDFGQLKDSIRFIYSDEKGDLWLAAFSGIYQVHFTGSSATEFELVRHDDKDLGVRPLTLRVIDGHFVVGTSKGLYKLVATAGEETVYRFLPAPSIGDSQIENHSKIAEVLYSQPDGFIIIISETYRFAIVRKGSDGNYHWDGNSLKKVGGKTIHRVYYEPDETAWLGTEDGLYRYDPRVQKNYQSDFRALIRSVIIGGKETIFEGAFYDPRSGQKRHHTKIMLEQPEDLVKELPFKQNNISFTFSATFYEHTEYNQFSYKLEGLEQDFSDWTSEHKKEYTNLYEGDYRFVVKAKNIFDHRGKTAYYRFSILAPWYRTTLAYIGYVGMFFFLMYLGIRINSHRLIEAKKRLEKIVAERTKQVREQRDQLKSKNEEISEAYLKLKDTQNQLLDASWKAGMADVASSVLHNIGNALNTVTVTKDIIQDRLKRSKVVNLGKTIEIINNSVDMVPKSEQGGRAVDYLGLLAEQLKSEQSTHLEEIERLSNGLERVNYIVASQRKYTEKKGVTEDLTPKELIKMAGEMSLLSSEEGVEFVDEIEYNGVISVERHKVIQILINLIHNAIKSFENVDRERKIVRIVVKTMEAGRVQFEVIDNGAGLEADALNRIFTFDRSGKRNEKDLDLHASANAAKSIGGSLVATSDGPEKGSSFLLELPLK